MHGPWLILRSMPVISTAPIALLIEPAALSLLQRSASSTVIQRSRNGASSALTPSTRLAGPAHREAVFAIRHQGDALRHPLTRAV